MEYNGWTNWETWNINLWIDNEYDVWKAKVDQLRYTNPDPISEELVKEFVVEWFPHGTPDFDDFRDLLNVNWKELAEHWQIEANELKEG